MKVIKANIICWKLKKMNKIQLGIISTSVFGIIAIYLLMCCSKIWQLFVVLLIFIISVFIMFILIKKKYELKNGRRYTG
jgi:phosphotransferase system  glucose/maltose/N-acetylglucosamine-specific IIC component